MHEAQGESLIFLRLAFSPTYERHSIRHAIEVCLESCDVSSVVAYELFGSHDLLLRVWAPRDTSAQTLEASFIAELTPLDLTSVELFTVSYPIRHWAFQSDTEAFPWPAKNDVHLLLDPEDIAQLESGSAERVLRDRAACKHLVHVNDTTSASERPGAKFAMIVRGANLSVTDLYSFEASLKNLLDAATGISERSLYAGEGFAHFLILGRVPLDGFYAINEELLAPLNAALVREAFSARTFTLVSGQRDYFLAQERLTGPPVSPRVDTSLASGSTSERLDLANLPAGHVLGDRYVVDRFVGDGSFGSVYKALDKQLNQTIALKLFKTADASAAVREVTFLQLVSHPNVVRVRHADRVDGVFFLAEDFVDGQSLLSHMESTQPPDDTLTVKIVTRLLDALIALHPRYERIEELRGKQSDSDFSEQEYDEFMRLKAEGIVHRDVKPGNVVLRASDGEPVLVDFNIASRAGDPIETTKHTPAYAPRDFAADQEWDTSIDLFAVGVIAFELLCGRHPYPECNPRLGVPVDAGSVRDDLPESMRQWLQRASAPFRTDRFLSAAQMRDSFVAASADLLFSGA